MSIASGANIHKEWGLSPEKHSSAEEAAEDGWNRMMYYFLLTLSLVYVGLFIVWVNVSE